MAVLNKAVEVWKETVVARLKVLEQNLNGKLIRVVKMCQDAQSPCFQTTSSSFGYETSCDVRIVTGRILA
jgi:hypothetical protein